MTGELFGGKGFRARVIGEADIERFQRFLEANPEYFLIVGGAPPRGNEALLEFHDRPPPEWSWDGKWLVAFDDPGGEMVAVADVVSNLIARGVWHIGLFIVATRLHGNGAARAMYAALEDWARSGGARWMRLNVAAGNVRAERFWESLGFAEARRREGVEIGVRVNTMRVLVKPLAGGRLPEYLEGVARDRPEAP